MGFLLSLIWNKTVETVQVLTGIQKNVILFGLKVFFFWRGQGVSVNEV